MLHLPSMITYGLLSFSMAFLNKALFEIANFRYSLFVIFIQLLFVIFSFEILAYWKIVSKPNLTSNEVYVFLIPSIFFSLSTILSLQALMQLNVAIYVVIKRCTPALTFLLSAIILKKQKLNFQIGLCVFAITFGAIITSIGDLTFHIESYFIGSLSVIFQSLYLLTIQRSSEQKTSSEVLYINSLLSLPMVFVLMILFSNDLGQVQTYQGYKTFSFWFYFLTSTFGGGLLNGATFWCTMKNSALTTSVAGVLKSILQVFFGLFVFDRLSINFNTIIGICLSLIAGTMFSYLEYTNKQKKLPLSTKNDCQDERIKLTLNSEEFIAKNSEKSNDETRMRRHSSNSEIMNNWNFLILNYLFFHFGFCNKSCSREGSRIVRDYFTRALGPIYEKHQIAIPLECVLSPIRDLFYRQELNKMKISNDKWLCKYCNKTFYSEYYLDLHFVNRHNNTLKIDEKTVCLADYCSIFRCDVLKKKKRSLKSLHSLARGSGMMTKRKTKKTLNEQQLNVFKTHCSSLINQCIPVNIPQDIRTKIRHQMYEEVCAYLTGNKYFELPNYRKPLVNFTVIFCLVIFVGMCLVAIGVITHSDWKLDENEENQSDKQLSDETNSTATSSVSNTSSNGIVHSSKNSSTLRQRVRSKPAEGGGEGGCQHSHAHSHVHHHEHF